MKKLVFTLILFAISLNILLAQAPQAALSVQGVLRNANGTAVANGNYAITFTLWKDSTSAAQADWVWSETITKVKVDGGIYSVVLGENPNQPLDAPFDTPYYLGVRIGGGNELIPRGRLTYSPYAMALLGTDNKFAHTGNVGIGTNSPTNMLTISEGTGSIGVDAKTDGVATLITANVDGLEFNTAVNSAYLFKSGNNELLRIQSDKKVGIGTSDPQSELHVKADNAIISVDGSAVSGMDFLKSGNTGGNVGFNNDDGDHLVLTNEIGKSGLKTAYGGALMLEEGKNELSFFTDGTNNVRRGFLGYSEANTNPNNLRLINEASGGNVKIGANDGIVEFISLVEIGRTPYTVGDWKFIGSNNANSGLWVNWVNHESGFDKNRNISLRAKGDVVAPMYMLNSDDRIKENKKLTDSEFDLALLNQLEVTDYQYIDKIAHGHQTKKGFIAQQVKSIFPEAVAVSKDFIPSVFCPSKKVTIKEDKNIIKLDKKHGFANGDNIKIINRDQELITKVVEVLNEYTFAISNNYELDEQVIVYGKEVVDFHTVDYDHIYTLAVSAVQELSSKVAALELENANLRSQADDSSASTLKLNAQLSILNKRLQDLENLYKSTSN